MKYQIISLVVEALSFSVSLNAFSIVHWHLLLFLHIFAKSIFQIDVYKSQKNHITRSSTSIVAQKYSKDSEYCVWLCVVGQKFLVPQSHRQKKKYSWHLPTEQPTKLYSIICGRRKNEKKNMRFIHSRAGEKGARAGNKPNHSHHITHNGNILLALAGTYQCSTFATTKTHSTPDNATHGNNVNEVIGVTCSFFYSIWLPFYSLFMLHTFNYHFIRIELSAKKAWAALFCQCKSSFVCIWLEANVKPYSFPWQFYIPFACADHLNASIHRALCC